MECQSFSFKSSCIFTPSLIHSSIHPCVHEALLFWSFNSTRGLFSKQRNREDLGAKEANCLGQKGSELPRAAAFGQSGSIQIHSNRPISSSNSPVIRHCPSCPHLFIHSLIYYPLLLHLIPHSQFSSSIHLFVPSSNPVSLPLSVNIMQMQPPAHFPSNFSLPKLLLSLFSQSATIMICHSKFLNSKNKLIGLFAGFCLIAILATRRQHSHISSRE